MWTFQYTDKRYGKKKDGKEQFWGQELTKSRATKSRPHKGQVGETDTVKFRAEAATAQHFRPQSIARAHQRGMDPKRGRNPGRTQGSAFLQENMHINLLLFSLHYCSGHSVNPAPHAQLVWLWPEPFP